MEFIGFKFNDVFSFFKLLDSISEKHDRYFFEETTVVYFFQFSGACAPESWLNFFLEKKKKVPTTQFGRSNEF